MAETELFENSRALNAQIEALSNALDQVSEHTNDESFLEELATLLIGLRGVKECMDYRPLASSPEGRRTWLHDFRGHLNIVQGEAELALEYEEETSRCGLEMLLREILLLVTVLDKDAAETTTFAHQSGDTPKLTGCILVVEDNDWNRQQLVKILLSQGHEPIEAANGQEAFDALKQHNIELILLDLNLPDMNGYDILQRLKAESAYRSVPVIVVSGQHEEEAVIRCIQAGAEDFQHKPVNQFMLRARIEGSLYRKSWRDREQKYTSALAQSHAFIRQTFSRYTSEGIVSRLLDHDHALELGGRLQDVTILMSDICSFTTICDQLEPQQVVQLLNNYLGLQTEVLFAHDGTIDEFIGDAILAVFGAPVEGEDDADRAVQCAIAMQNEMHAVNSLNERYGLPPIETSIAINSGAVVAGNIGSTRRSKYAVVGQPVNLTARIEEATRVGEILMSESTRNLLCESYHFGPTRSIKAKGFSEPVTVQVVHPSAEKASAPDRDRRDRSRSAHTGSASAPVAVAMEAAENA